MDRVQAEPASFRDRSNVVFYAGGAVLRGLAADSAGDWEALRQTAFFTRRVADGHIVATKDRVGEVAAPPDLRAAEWVAMLEHERVPFISYPYEWPFTMLKDAALLHVDLLLDALAEAMTMKDGYAYNIQWHGSRPTFIDIPSFERAEHAGPWAGYRQFCQTFLFPLMLQAHKRVPYQPWLRGSLEGIEAAHIRHLFWRRDLFRAGVLKHVVLHDAVQKRFRGGSNEMKDELRSAGFGTEMVRATVQNIRKVVGKLERRDSRSTWSDYRETCTYTDADAAAKEAFVRRELAEARPSLAWDIGCNDGAYSRIAAESADYVVAMDLDELVVDRLYTQLRDEDERRILPLVVNLADPSPGLGWKNAERRPLGERARPDFVLALAVLHHLTITANVPLTEILDWFASLGAAAVLEFVEPNDPQVVRLLGNKPAGQHQEYHRENFERWLGERLEVGRMEALPSGTRVLYAVRPKS